MVEFLRSGQYFEAIEIAEKLQRDEENSEYANLSGLILAQLLVFNKQEAEAEDVLIKIVKSTSKLELNKIAAARLQDYIFLKRNLIKLLKLQSQSFKIMISLKKSMLTFNHIRVTWSLPIKSIGNLLLKRKNPVSHPRHL